VKICSFLPAATAMLYALGLQEALCGVTHQCNFPPEAKEKPVVLRPAFDPRDHDSGTIDRLVREALSRGEPLYRPALDLLRALDPDLLITQSVCEVCAFSPREAEAVREALGGRPRILELNPGSLAEMLRDLERIAEAAGAPERGKAVRGALEARIDWVARGTAGLVRPRVACIEWFDPLFSAGHWMPELVELAGGEEGLGAKHGYSQELSWDQVVAYQPEVLVLMPCGFDVSRTLAELPLLERLPGWTELPAMRGRTWAVWGDKYFSGASPYLVDGLELLARILHPERFPEPIDPREAVCLTTRLFVYGSLMTGQWNHGLLAPFVRACQPARAPRMKLYPVTPDYPGMVEGDGEVRGELVELDPARLDEAMAVLDELEDYFGPGNPSNEYDRVQVPVQTADGAWVHAWAYLWNGRVDGLAPIPGGDWRRFRGG
jgi:iron complex transport system substrate-binding protein